LRYLSLDEDLRRSIDNVIVTLGVKGMSDDETDSDGSKQSRSAPKTLRRRKLWWLSNDVSLLMDAIESYRPAVSGSALFDARGNKALERRFEPHNINDQSLPVSGLPRNWYDRSFYQNLHMHEKKKLHRASDVDLPFLVSCYEPVNPPLKPKKKINIYRSNVSRTESLPLGQM
jgi:hypothetical protein